MNGKIILNLYKADEEGGFDWIVGDGSDTLNTKNKIDFDKFLEGINVVVMGRNCYNQNFHNEYKDKDVYIATSDDMEDYENYHFIKGDICKQISDLKEEGKNIFLFGGGKMIDPFIKDDIIDEYIIGIIPTILGKGRRLFLGNNPKIDLKLQEYSVEDGIVIMRYSKRSN